MAAAGESGRCTHPQFIHHHADGVYQHTFCGACCEILEDSDWHHLVPGVPGVTVGHGGRLLPVARLLGAAVPKMLPLLQMVSTRFGSGKTEVLRHLMCQTMKIAMDQAQTLEIFAACVLVLPLPGGAQPIIVYVESGAYAGCMASSELRRALGDSDGTWPAMSYTTVGDDRRDDITAAAAAAAAAAATVAADQATEATAAAAAAAAVADSATVSAGMAGMDAAAAAVVAAATAAAATAATAAATAAATEAAAAAAAAPAKPFTPYARAAAVARLHKVSSEVTAGRFRHLVRVRPRVDTGRVGQQPFTLNHDANIIAAAAVFSSMETGTYAGTTRTACLAGLESQAAERGSTSEVTLRQAADALSCLSTSTPNGRQEESRMFVLGKAPRSPSTAGQRQLALVLWQQWRSQRSSLRPAIASALAAMGLDATENGVYQLMAAVAMDGVELVADLLAHHEAAARRPSTQDNSGGQRKRASHQGHFGGADASSENMNLAPDYEELGDQDNERLGDGQDISSEAGGLAGKLMWSLIHDAGMGGFVCVCGDDRWAVFVHPKGRTRDGETIHADVPC